MTSAVESAFNVDIVIWTTIETPLLAEFPYVCLI
jgi:hypothetical protein